MAVRPAYLRALPDYWNRQAGSRFGPMVNNASKYVVSSTLTEPLAWPNSTLVHDDPAGAVAVLKEGASSHHGNPMGASADTVVPG